MDIGIVYILKSLKNGTYYIGSTNNLDRRINEHFCGKCKYTKTILPIQLVFSQNYKNLKTARSVEYWLKSRKNKDIIERIVRERIILGP